MQRKYLAYLGIFLTFSAVMAIIVLTLIGPAVGTIFSNIVTNFNAVEGGGGGSYYVPPTPAAMTFDNPGTNPVITTTSDHLSTFAMDVDTASYTLTRSYLTQHHQLPPADSIRPEEFINYFEADYPAPEGTFAINLDAAPSPFGTDGQHLFRVGIQGQYIDPSEREPALLIFVIDVSGSMDMENRLGLVKETLTLLVGQLREDDRIGIVVYSDNSRVILEPTPASERTTILDAIASLKPEGSTNAEAGLLLGYQLAASYQDENHMTRIILCSDGVANVGSTGPDAILAQIRDSVDRGITLTTVGFGMGNYNDVLMEQLANDGDGNYYYVDDLREARRVFVHNLTGTLQVIGYNARVQVDFNPEAVESYRLIGYENRAIADDAFRDDSTDAGEVGAGHSITALYEITPNPDASVDSTLATVYVRYENAETRAVEEIQETLVFGELRLYFEDAPADFRLMVAAAEFSELLRQSPYASGSFVQVHELVMDLYREAPQNEQVKELAELVTRARY